ncbi:hypothetical protein [Nocardia goodfellowii]|uniref:MFS family arabinose efflux permease n=1 Tax=Nocardia goodfellowii TaxID=882446 RepID=A0ABS4QI32_9NOCA|nr:hypothetical protein [Nocardia goodfellowii]MBP2191355.1 putative MFS family arabinose efflux permease [Nocardia goodfellowii]
MASLCAFVAANAAAAGTSSFTVLLILRVAAAAAAAVAIPALFATAVQRASAAMVGRYVAVVALGVTRSIPAIGFAVGTSARNRDNRALRLRS